MSETYDIKTKIEIGRQIFENIPNEIKPCWAGLVLSCFNNYLKDIPTPVRELFPIIDDKDKWKNAHKQFTKIREFGLDNQEYHTEYLRLAEIVAKVTYNASGEPAPFDSGSGYHIASLALKVAENFDDNRLEEEVKSAILLFNRYKRLKNNLTAAKNIILYKKIDDILWFDWDPNGVKDIAPRNEYQSYIPEIFELVKAKADRQAIADRLLKLETENMGMVGTIENCLRIADKILAIQ